MESAVLQFVLSALVIVAAGTVLTRCTDRMAELTGLGRLLMGSIFLAAATSLPELATDLNAIWLGQPDLAVGDLFGSSLFNLFILAVLDVTYRKPTERMFSRMASAHALSATMSLTLTAVAGMAMVSGIGSSYLGLGPFSWALLIVYLLGIRLVYYDQQKAAAEAEPEPKAPGWGKTVALNLAGYVASAGVILVVAPYLAVAADRLAVQTGVGHTFVGTTLVALATSLPELVATFVALRMGSYDLALGGIFGSNSFNMVLFVALDAAQPGPLLASVQRYHAVTAFGVILVTTVAMLSLLYRAERRITFIEPGAELIILLILGTLFLLYHLNP
ncbi:MAG: sodium:calcium antiporter [Planctomycetota bacterium]|nr:sodium:calcium antiporter [Planctomycetota bacterium]